MCESMLGCEGVAYMTWWWIHVLEASRSSRLSCGMPYAQLTQRKMCKSMLTLLILGNFFISDSCKRFVSNQIMYCYVVTSWLWMLFLSHHFSSLPDERFVFARCHASSDDGNGSPFQLSLVHAISQKCVPLPSLNDNGHENEPISISWQNVLRWWMAQMRKDSWDDSLPLNIVTCLLRSFRRYAYYSFAALHCVSPSRFISGTTAPAGPVSRSLS